MTKARRQPGIQVARCDSNRARQLEQELLAKGYSLVTKLPEQVRPREYTVELEPGEGYVVSWMILETE